jgi:hypothetical protein
MKHVVIEKVTHTGTAAGYAEASILSPSWEFRKIVDMYCSRRTNTFTPWNPPIKDRSPNDNFVLNLPNHEFLHVGEFFGINGVAVREVVSGTVDAIIKQKYGTDCVIVYEVEEEVVQLKCAADLLKLFFENHQVMFTETKESGLNTVHTSFINREHASQCSSTAASANNHYTEYAKKVKQVVSWPEFFKKHNIIPKRIFVYNNNFSVNHTGDIAKIPTVKVLNPAPTFWAHTLTWRPNMLWELDCDQKQKMLDNVELSYNNQENKMSFVAMIHKPRIERIMFVNELDQIGLLDHNDWSLFYNPKGQVLMTEKKVRLNARGYLSFIEKYKSILPKVLDKNIRPEEISKGYGLYSSKSFEHAYYYVNPVFSQKYKTYLSFETTAVDPARTMLTEKTFKGFAQGLPTIVISTANCLPALTKMGFKMDIAMSLNYDNIQNNEIRIKHCARQLATINQIDSHKLKYEALHNLEHFLDYDAATFAIIDPLLDIIKEPDIGL